MDNRQAGLVRLTTRVDSKTLDEIERLAKARRTNVAQDARCLIEDAIQALGNRRLKRIRRTMMPNLSKTGNATHDANCQSALLIWQNAMASATTQAQATAADVTFYKTVRDSAFNNGLPHVEFVTALRNLGVASAAPLSA